MCGRYSLVSKIEVIEKRFDVQATFDHYFNPNIAATDLAPIITNAAPTELQLHQFGFQPPWATKSLLLINARSEGDGNLSNDRNYRGSMGIIQKPAFRKPIRSNRCLVIADAFIEGPEKEKLNKPHLVFPTHQFALQPFAMAGIWESWTDPLTQALKTGFSIITRASTPITHLIGHHRAPVVLSPADERDWLDPNLPLAEVIKILEKPPHENWNAYPIHAGIKNATRKDAEVLRPTGPALLTSMDFHFHEKLQLSGMGSSPARLRRAAENEQLKLF